MNLQLRVPPVAWIAVCGGLMGWLDRAAPLRTLLDGPVQEAGWLVMTGGAVIIGAAVMQFRQARTTVDPTRPAKASSLVRHGIFAYSRNPMYLGMAVALCGWAVLLGSLSPWFVAALFPVVITWLQIKPEEAVLSTLFGRDYDDYCTRVSRWFGRED